MFKSIMGLGFPQGGRSRNDIQKIIKEKVDSGAAEFFTGYNPPYWHEKFGFEVSPNGRFAEHEQINNFNTLKEVIDCVHSHDIKIMGNLNARYYNSTVEKEIENIIEDFLVAGIDGFICGSLGILEYLDSIAEDRCEGGYIIKGKKIQINISTILAVYNKEAIEYLLEQYPIAKIILSREITLKEIEDIVSYFPKLEFEVFGEGDFCRYNNGLCFAEHKYTDRDICTVVVNDLIINKIINYNFRETIQTKDLSNADKVATFDNIYINEFQQLEELLSLEELVDSKREVIIKIDKLLHVIKAKYILYYDSLETFTSTNNKNIRILISSYNKVIKELGELPFEDQEFHSYLQSELKFGLQANLSKIKELQGGQIALLSKQKDTFYNRSDILNLYSYIFFNKFKNIQTVKFPTRGRNYTPKLKLITDVLNKKQDIDQLLDLSNIPSRTHYDLSHIFGDNKLWFYDIRKNLHKNMSY